MLAAPFCTTVTRTMLMAQFRTTSLRTMLAGERGADSVRLSLQTAHRFPLAGECPLFSAWGRFEDGAPAPRDRLRRKV